MASLYIHIPFCRHKCIYCDFYSTTQLNQIEKYLPALQREIDLWANDTFFQNQEFSTLYFGGGTPSLLSSSQISDILKKLHSSFNFKKDAEISIEANPGALLQANLYGYRKAGINRLTLGVQSFNDEELQFLTRIHSVYDAHVAFKTARQAGFENIGLDLIFGLPGQRLKSWEQNCRTAIELDPEHISMYGLTYEQNTPLWQKLEKGAVHKCDEELERDMFLLGIDILKKAGYEQYEISNFARPGYYSRHNQSYWDASPFLSLGPSAHSFDGDKRWWNVNDVNSYLNALGRDQLPIKGEEQLTHNERVEELVLLGLRRQLGIDLDEWGQLTNQSVSELLFKLEKKFGALDSIGGFEPSTERCFLTVNENRLSLTQHGLLLYNNICENICLL